MTNLQMRMLATELADIVGREQVLTDPVDRLCYGVDVFWVPRLLIDRGETPPTPELVVLPGTGTEVAAVVQLANRYHVPVVPWGGGSGSQGGIIPLEGGITIDLKRLCRIVEISETNGTVTAEAGINGFALECALNERGLTLPNYPASVHSATLGGYLAARGSGVISTKYGKAEDMVLSVQVVLPTGDLIRTLPFPTHAAGPGILQLFVGAEGSYGIVTEATMRVERLPETRRFHALMFDRLGDGLEAGRQIMLARLQPIVIRLYDEVSTVKVVKRTLGTDVTGGAYMVIGFDGSEAAVEFAERQALAIAASVGGCSLGREPAEDWWNRRFDFYFPPHAPDFPAMFGTLDTLTTFDRIERLYETKKERLERTFAEWGLVYYAHFSHWFPWGVMVYDRFHIEDPPADSFEALALHNDIWNLGARTSVECGGVLNEHHGVGLKLARLMREQYGPAFQVLEGLKHVLDPRMILNPGKMGFQPPR